jgi:hypothetical protein
MTRTGYGFDLSSEARLSVSWETRRGKLRDYEVMLIVREGEAEHTVRLYDNRHGISHVHRYTRSGGKQAGEEFHSGRPDEAMREAIAQASTGYERMIEGWRRG